MTTQKQMQHVLASPARTGWLRVVTMLSFALAMITVLVHQDAANAEVERNPPLNEGEKLFRAMEERILKAETVQVAFQGENETAGKVEDEGKWKGTFVLAGKNKVRMSFNGAIFGPPCDFLLVADGENYRFTYPENAPVSKKCPDKMSENLLHSLTRYITFPMHLIIPLDPKGEDKITRGYGVSDFQFTRNEKIGGRDTNVITYKMQFSDHRRFVSTIWIDTASQLPVKRITDNGEGQQELIVEFFKDWKLGEKVDEHLFKLEK
jgi:hypothetical protein